jgi:hypothetical protein
MRLYITIAWTALLLACQLVVARDVSNRRDLRAGYDENEFLPGVADEVDNAKHYVPADDDEPYYGAGIEGGWGSQSLRIDRLQNPWPILPYQYQYPRHS